MRSIVALVLVLAATLAPAPAAATESAHGEAQAHVFWRVGCPHCARLREFLDRLVASEPSLAVAYHEVGADAANRELLMRLAQRFDADRVAVPFAVVGDRYWIGYFDDASTGGQIAAALQACRDRGCPDRVAELRRAIAERADARPAPAAASSRGVPDAKPPAPSRSPGDASTDAAGPAGASPAAAPADPPGPATASREPGAGAPAAAGPATASPLPRTLHLPLVGEVAAADLSLPALTVVLGALDGFNPCAMWTLVFLIGLLLGMEDRRRRWLLGGAFIAASAAVYFLFMAAWLNALVALGLVPWIRAAIGTLAIAGGAWYLVQFARRRDAACTVTSPARRQRVFARLRAIAQERRFALALAAIVALAFAVNLVELICSAGIPAVYAQVLALTPMPAWQHYGYIALYIAVFMLDDLLVFTGAMLTLEMAAPAASWARWSHLVGGVVLLGLGVLLLLRPEWLVFG